MVKTTSIYCKIVIYPGDIKVTYNLYTGFLLGRTSSGLVARPYIGQPLLVSVLTCRAAIKHIWCHLASCLV